MSNQNGNGPKTALETAFIPGRRGGRLLPGGKPGNKGGGRHPDWLKKFCDDLLASPKTKAAVRAILSDPKHPAFSAMWKAAGERARRAQQIYALAYACMHYRSAKLSEPPLWIFEEQDGEEVPIDEDHPLGEWLEQPNPDMGMQEFMELVSLYWDATGAVLLVKNRDRAGIPRSVYPYARDEFQVEQANGRLYGKFRVQTLTGFRE